MEHKKIASIAGGDCKNIGDGLSYQFQFVDDIAGTTQFINTPQHIPYVYTNGTVKVLIKGDFMTKRFVVSVECQSE